MESTPTQSSTSNNEEGNPKQHQQRILPPLTTLFEVNVFKESFKFNAAHFVAFPGFRERLHGHEYRLKIRLLGSRVIGQDGYVLDFGDVKAVTKKVCKNLNEYFICPMYSPVLQINKIRGKGDEGDGGDDGDDDENIESIEIICEDGAKFLFPRIDCALLPIAHSTAEELAIHLWGEVLLGLDATFLVKRGIHTMEVTCAEAVGQEAVFRKEIPDTNDKDQIRELCNVRSYISSGAAFPRPCPTARGNALKNTQIGYNCNLCGK